MKKLIIYSTLLTLLGCQNLEKSSSPVAEANGCPEKPSISLRENEVEEVSLNEQIVTKSGQAKANKAIGYQFQAESGQKLSYATDADVCIWVFAPDNEILTSRNLEKTGKYIIQVSAPQGTKSFDLQMSLDIPQVAANSNVSLSSTNSIQPRSTVKPQEESRRKINPSVINRNQSQADNEQPSNNNTKPTHDITQEEALELVQQWYAAKPRIFGPPYDTNLVSDLTTGPLYANLISSDGPIAWLIKYDSYYTYNKSKVTNIIDFSNNDDKPYIKVKVDEELYLHTSKGVDQDSSGSYQGVFVYFFEKENSNWKISGYRKIS
ncbi:ARC6/PARC6 family protein [Anabaena sp. CA = ATCC 33047]|uniref:ARC6/PARC6 family protein n=1 Tax=Anabaena sp. (strain CA / ATCC 33047) TaxID=52271 RepID=UPI00082C2CBD|nr:ARC6/PARC6 family protein [Anabaena sp. CA = ATCC 33047]